MSFSLDLQNGDLVLSGTAFGTVTDAAKLQQDLICAILTPLGFDELHPTYGSILEENLINPEIPGIFGETDFRHAATIIHAELVRICQNYQGQQIARNEADASQFGKYTLTPGEILLKVNGINFVQAEDHLICTLKLEIGNDSLELRIPMPQVQSA